MMKEMRSATAILPSFKSGFLGECSNLKIVGSKNGYDKKEIGYRNSWKKSMNTIIINEFDKNEF